MTRALRVPLTTKLLGANIVIVAAALAAAVYTNNIGTETFSFTGILVIAMLVGTAINVLLTYTALRPIRDIEGTITRMLRGDTTSRVTSSAVADPELDRIGLTLNSLLDQLERDRDAMRSLAAEIVIAEDRQQRRIATQLHESVAQSLASITCMLTALAAKSTERDTAGRIMEIRGHVGDVLDEVDVLSHTIHPRVLNDLGLGAGLRALAFSVSSPELPVAVHIAGCEDQDLRDLGPDTSSGLYRIAQEAVQNAIRHSGADRIDISVNGEGPNLVVRITDDGKGFNVDEAERRRPRRGLLQMRQRAQLINAKLRIDTAPREGTCIEVTMPLGATTFTG